MYPAPLPAGVHVGIPWWIGAGSPLDGIEEARSIEVDFVEISLDAPWPEDLSAPDLRQAAEQAGVGLGLHGPWRTQALAHPRSVLSRAAQTVAQDCVDFALGAGADYIVFHVDARDFGRFPEPSAVERGLEQAQASLRALSRTAGDEVDVLVENTSSPLGTPEEVESFLDPLPDAGFCYDPGHAALAEEAMTEGASADPRAWTKRLGDRLELLHLMDHVQTEAGIVDHLVPGAGASDIEELLEATQDAGCDRVLIEAFFRNVERQEARTSDLAEARDRIRSLL